MKIIVVGQTNCNFRELISGHVKWFTNEKHEGLNIDFMNPWCCELSGLYHLWKEENSDPNEIVGLEHYRRYFVKNNSTELMDETYIDNVLKDYDVICQKFSFGYSTPLNWWGNCLKPYIFKFIDCLEDRDFANWYLKELKTCHNFCRCNMFICKRELMNQYCECLFNTISRMKPNDFIGRKRILGYIGEYFMGFWFRYYGYKIAYKSAIEYDKSVRRITKTTKAEV